MKITIKSLRDKQKEFPQTAEKFFQKPFEEARRIMLHVHVKGRGVCGIYPKEIAETKVSQVVDYSRAHEFPLQCTMEEA